MPSQPNAPRLVDAYLAESITISRLPPPHLREVPSARRLYAAEPRLRLAVAIECGHRIAKVITQPYVATSVRRRFLDRIHSVLSLRWLLATIKNVVQAARQRISPVSHGWDYLLLGHHDRLVRLFRLLLFRLPPVDSGQIRELLEVVPARSRLDLRMFPVRPMYHAVITHLRAADSTPPVHAMVAAHHRLLSPNGPEPPTDTLALAEAVLAVYPATE